MAKDSRRSSVAGSAHLSPRDAGDEPPAQEPEQLGEARPKASPSAPPIDDSRKPSDSNGSNARATESQPMTASNSTSSNPSTKEGGANGTGSAAPYGTRSRNRTGNPRPNYAEDKEIDAEFELPAAAKEVNGRKAARAADQASVPEIGRSANTTRKNPSPESDQVVTVQSHYKEPIPGTSTFSANPAQSNQTSRKRKATGQPATTTFQTQLQVPVQNVPTTQPPTRKASMAAQVAAGFRESNMLSFEDCGGRLNGKKLVADDGTVLEVNGKWLHWTRSCLLRS